ncbi:MAG: D-alanine--D-alanine ligase [Proteobacteria bacterium]|nr:MAG: D-alanine--D-alanine ligase [Pseudomonadota bacterium]
MPEKTKLLLLFGGQSCEHEVSVTSARSVLEAVDRERYQLTLVGIGKSGRWLFQEDPVNAFAAGIVDEDHGLPVLMDFGDGGRLRSTRDPSFSRDIDVVFPLLHGPHGEDGTIQGLLELAGVAYVGAGVVGSAVAMDKEMMRRAFAAEGLRQTDWVTVSGASWRSGREAIVEQCVSSLSFPMFAKPCNLGSSVGVGKAYDEGELADAIDDALRFDTRAMVERGVEDAQEVECAVLGNRSPKASPLGEIIPGADFYNYETKYIDDKSQLIIPARLDAACTEQVRREAVRAFEAVQAFGLARVDFLVRKDEPRVLVNEINTMPGFTPISMYPKLWQSAGMSYSALIDRLVALAIERRAETAGLSNSL